jgi:uncharacterized protein
VTAPPGGAPAPGLFEPPVTEAGAPFWDASRERRFILPHSPVTGRAMWFPREVDPTAPDRPVEWREASGAGVVHAASVHHKPGPGRDPADGPYVVALIDLDEGVRMLSNVVGCDPDDVVVGMRVRLTWRPLSDGRHLPQFTPVVSAES